MAPISRARLDPGAEGAGVDVPDPPNALLSITSHPYFTTSLNPWVTAGATDSGVMGVQQSACGALPRPKLFRKRWIEIGAGPLHLQNTTKYSDTCSQFFRQFVDVLSTQSSRPVA